jgi:hypothetical protein
MMRKDIIWEVNMGEDTVIIQGHRKFQSTTVITQERLLPLELWEPVWLPCSEGVHAVDTRVKYTRNLEHLSPTRNTPTNPRGIMAAVVAVLVKGYLKSVHWPGLVSWPRNSGIDERRKKTIPSLADIGRHIPVATAIQMNR